MPASSKYKYDAQLFDLDRLDKGWTVEQFALKAKLSRRPVYYFLAGRVMTDTTAMRLASALGQPVSRYMMPKKGGRK